MDRGVKLAGEDFRKGDAPFQGGRGQPPPLSGSKFSQDYESGYKDNASFPAQSDRYGERGDYYGGEEYSEEYPEHYAEREGEGDYYDDKNYPPYSQDREGDFQRGTSQGRGIDFPKGRGFPMRDEVEQGRGFESGRGQGRGFEPGSGQGRGFESGRGQGRDFGRDDNRGYGRDGDEFPPGRNFPPDERRIAGRGLGLQAPTRDLPLDREGGLGRKKADWDSGAAIEKKPWSLEEPSGLGR
jgi:hypothetical protein